MHFQRFYQQARAFIQFTFGKGGGQQGWNGVSKAGTRRGRQLWHDRKGHTPHFGHLIFYLLVAALLANAG